MDKGRWPYFNGIPARRRREGRAPRPYVKAQINNLGPGKINTSGSDQGIQTRAVDKTGQKRRASRSSATSQEATRSPRPTRWAVGLEL